MTSFAGARGTLAPETGVRWDLVVWWGSRGIGCTASLLCWSTHVLGDDDGGLVVSTAVLPRYEATSIRLLTIPSDSILHLQSSAELYVVCQVLPCQRCSNVLHCLHALVGYVEDLGCLDKRWGHSGTTTRPPNKDNPC